MNYIGSKKRLLKLIESVIKEYCGEDISGKTFCDIFAGTGSVAAYFRPLVNKVIVNDLESYSQLTNRVMFNGYDRKQVKWFIDRFNGMVGSTDNPLYDAYVEGGARGRLYFTKENGVKMCEARDYVEDLRPVIDPKTYDAALLSIMEAADRVSNTMGTYGAFANKPEEIEKTRAKKIDFRMPFTVASYSDDGQLLPNEDVVAGADANELIKQISGDILYLDPPYNDRQYGQYYHVLNAIVTLDIPDRDTKTGTPKVYNKSAYCDKRKVKEALNELIENAKFEWIFMSYNNEGLLSFDDIREVMSKYGTYNAEITEFQRYKADNNREQKASSTFEYIHVLHKGVFSGNGTTEDPAKKMIMNKPSDMDWDDLGISDDDFTFDIEEETETAEKPTEPKPNFIVSPMNYMGGKKKLIKELTDNFPKDIKVFIDLFCGGATVGINAEADWVLFNDNLVPLIKMYNYMKQVSAEKCVEYIDGVIEKWGLVQGPEGEDNYYRFRDEYYNATPMEKRHPLDLFVLMAFSFNNQIRFAINKNWKFNIPFGKNRSSFNAKMRENLVNFVNALHKRNCMFLSLDFMKVPIDKNVFVYADPPYLVSQATYNDGWDEECEKRLLGRLKELDDMGGKFALSNVLENKGKVNEILSEWVEKNGYNIVHLNKSYSNSYYSRKKKETATDEVLIMNYTL